MGSLGFVARVRWPASRVGRPWYSDLGQRFRRFASFSAGLVTLGLGLVAAV